MGGGTVGAVVINVGTELSTTLALASLRARAPQASILLLNMDPKASSTRHFRALSDEWGFAVEELPLQPHGVALDHIVREATDDLVLFLDSDAEILQDRTVERMIAACAPPDVYGSGWLLEAEWHPWTNLPEICWAPERIWTPCMVLRVDAVRAALDAGVSFRREVILNEFRWSPRIARRLASRFDEVSTPRSRAIERLPDPLRRRLARSRLSWLTWARPTYDGVRPHYVLEDTASRVHAWCLEHGHRFAVLDDWWDTEVAHLSGLSRAVRGRAPDLFDLDEVEQDLVARLAGYGVSWEAFDIDAVSWTAQ